MIAFTQIANLLADADQPLSEMINQLKRYAQASERVFLTETTQAVTDQLANTYSDARIDFLDGISVQYDNWWFNIRPCDQKPAVKLNLEAENEDLLQQKLVELTPLLGTPLEE
jgi:phosphomannomutase